MPADCKSAGTRTGLQICRNDWPERKTVVDKRYALRNSVGVIPVRDLNMVVKYSALSK